MAKARSKVNAAVRDAKKAALKKIMDEELVKAKAGYAAGKFDAGATAEARARDAEKQLRAFTRRKKKKDDGDPLAAAARAMGL